MTWDLPQPKAEPGAAAGPEIAAPVPSTARPLRELAVLFLRLGATSFGGPAAHIALMEDEVVRRRRWLSREKFLDLLGAANLIPGPSSTEMAIHIGYLRAGWPGLVVAGACFILPAALLVVAIAWAYQKYGSLPEITGILYGVKPVIIAVIAQAGWRLGRVCLKTPFQGAVGVLATVLGFLGLNQLVLLVGAGIILGFKQWFAQGLRPVVKPLLVFLGITTVLVVAMLVLPRWTEGVIPFSQGALFLYFLKIGSVLFGSGYVLLAFLRTDLVGRWHWLTAQQLLDAVAVGQVTPGPVFTTATFIGYLLGGPWGALLATLGIFLPGFFFVAVSGPLVPRLRQSAIAGAFLDGVNVASLALLAIVTWELAGAALVSPETKHLDPVPVALALGSAVLLFRYRMNSAWLVLGGALAGLGVTLATR